MVTQEEKGNTEIFKVIFKATKKPHLKTKPKQHKKTTKKYLRK